MPAPEGNQYALGNDGGRPALFRSSEQLWSAFEEYLEETKDKAGKAKATISGMAYHLGFESRQSLYDYEKRSEEFSFIIKKMRLFVESCYEKQLYTFNATGAIFALKNMGWKDKTEQEINGNQTITLVQPQVLDTKVPLSTSEKEVDQ